jgi:hypothetical protein
MAGDFKITWNIADSKLEGWLSWQVGSPPPRQPGFTPRPNHDNVISYESPSPHAEWCAFNQKGRWA